MSPRERREFGIFGLLFLALGVAMGKFGLFGWPGAAGIFLGLLGWAMVWTFRDRLKART